MRIFVAGATGATGQVLVPAATAAGHELVLHVRPQTAQKSPLGRDARARVFDLSDGAALAGALAGCEVVVSLVGTMRARFGAGDTYASSDVGSARQLTDGARAAGVPRFLLLSSVGAGGVGAYLKMKGECERIVQESGLAWTIFRPSTLESPAGATESHHGTRPRQRVLGGIVGAVGALPGLGGWAARMRPIGIDVLVRAMLRVVDERRDGAVIEGATLFELGAARSDER